MEEILNFVHPEDLKYFADQYCNGDSKIVSTELADYFDFREPKIKRGEFNKTRNKIYEKLGSVYGYTCMLKLLPTCLETMHLAIDHIIPLSSNILNKELRHMTAPTGHAPTQSFGSNNIKNLILACSKCNNHKKHRFLTTAQWDKVQQLKKLLKTTSQKT
jgi:5-methylcytosine-specific restriction endonuclease McrA